MSSTNGRHEVRGRGDDTTACLPAREEIGVRLELAGNWGQTPITH